MDATMKKKTILYGMGSWIEGHYIWLREHFDIIGAYDRDVSKKEKAEEIGIPFLTLENLKAQEYGVILVTSTFEKEITDYLVNELNIKKEILSGNCLYKEWEEQYYGKVNRFGDKFPDKTFAVIQLGDGTHNTGLLNLFCCFVRGIYNAINLGQIPVIDVKNFYSIYHENYKEIGKVNIWDMFFKQPYPEYHLEDVLKASNVVYARCIPPMKNVKDNFIWKQNGDFVSNLQFRKKYHSVFKKYLCLSDRTAKEYQCIYDKIFLPHKKASKKILGVSIRGTDYVALKPFLHNIQPSREDVIEKIREILEEWEIDMIYVNSDEEKSIQYVKKAFPGMVFSMDYQRFDSYNENSAGLVGAIRFEQEDDSYRRGADYLISTLLLADCDCFIGSINGCCNATLIMTEGFEHEYIFDKGLYGIDDDAYSYTPDGNPIYVEKQI